MAILLVIVCCCSLLPFPCSAVCKGRAFGDFGQGAEAGPRGGGDQFDQGGGEGGPGRGGNQFDQGGGEAAPGAGGNHVGEGVGLSGGNQVGRTPPAPRGKTPRNHR
ncbi:hypothetical protein CFC21_033339 [Triticum aestivum]|uniref:Secreted protein n=2 Tax=Triticum aestivum TaxID=4565 RepID=A0A9R1F1A1_WHEAT|nr:hypothetical protein CFC21_033339 [Triticum aestivum]